MFNPELKIGQVLKNSDIIEVFKCGNQGGMRRSKATNTLVLISDYTKGLYHDKWIGGVLHYTGMGKIGDQDIHWAQNATLAGYRRNNVDIHLFEVLDAGEYTYCGRVELVGEPYTERQAGEDGLPRKVWMFPIRPVPDNDVRKPAMFVFKDVDDYIARGKNVDAEYIRMVANRKNIAPKISQSVQTTTVTPPPAKNVVSIPNDIIGKSVKHKSYGEGIVTAISGKAIIVHFSSVGDKNLGYEICINNKLIEIL